MKRFTIIWIGKTINKSAHMLIEDYKKRLGYLAKIDCIEIRDAKSIDEETESILKRLPKQSYVICLDEKGNSYSSIEFNQRLEKLTNSYQHFVFIIGSAYGLSDSLKSYANELISLSKMTFTHDMVRPFLLEQLYRSEMISKGSAYHH